MITLFSLVFIILPTLFIFKLFKHYKKDNLNKASFLRYMGILYIDNKPNCFMWEVSALIFVNIII